MHDPSEPGSEGGEGAAAAPVVCKVGGACLWLAQHLSGVSVPAVNGYHTSGTPAHPPETAHMSVRKSTGDSQVRGPVPGCRGSHLGRPREVSFRMGMPWGSRWLQPSPAPGGKWSVSGSFQRTMMWESRRWWFGFL